jgi:hypothetical protein
MAIANPTASIVIPEIVPPERAAELLGTNPGTLNVWRCTRRYALPYVKIGRRVFYKTDDIARFIESRTVGAAAK